MASAAALAALGITETPTETPATTAVATATANTPSTRPELTSCRRRNRRTRAAATSAKPAAL